MTKTTDPDDRLRAAILAALRRANRPLAWSEIRSAASYRPRAEVRRIVDELVAAGTLTRTTRTEAKHGGPRAPKPLRQRDYYALL